MPPLLPPSPLGAAQRRALLLAVVASLAGGGVAWAGSVERPVDAAYTASLPYGSRSFWVQPWRGWMDTWPASRLRAGLGINFNVSAAEAPAAARTLAAAGFRRARVEMSWNSMAFEDESRVSSQHAAGIRARLVALRDAGIRPLILLNANHGEPTPSRRVEVRLAQAAAAGASSVRLEPGSVAQVVVGRSGFDAGGMAAGVLVTGVGTDGVARLSRPLPSGLAAGAQPLRVLTQEPFAAPMLAGGGANPRFERTLAGWLRYVRGTTSYVRGILGSDRFDVEVWNELGFGSSFLTQSAYYASPTEAASGDVPDALLRRTVATLRDPANGVSGVGIGNGFTNQTGLVAGADQPVGVTAMDKHPYANGELYPQNVQYAGTPVDALGRANYTQVGNVRKDTFVPTFRDFFPEHNLTAITDGLGMIRDLAPQTTAGFRGRPRGRTAAPGGGRPPAMWVTEYNLNASVATVFASGGMTEADRERFKAKVALRSLTAYIGKGVTQVDLFAAKGGQAWQLVSQPFFDAIRDKPSEQPAAELAGPTVAAVGRLAKAMQGPATISTPRSLTLDRISDTHDHVQFAGNGTAAHPPLFNRERLAFFPFQADEHRFVVPVYVMTVDMARAYAPVGAANRFDLPAERYELTIGGVAGSAARVSYADPLSGEARPATIVRRTSSTITVALDATDSPRLLTIVDDEPSATTAGTGPSIAAVADPVAARGGGSGPQRPTLRIVAASRLRRVVRRSGPLVALRCPGGCSFALGLVPARADRPRLAHRVGRVPAGRTVRVRLRPTRAGRRWLRRRDPRGLRIAGHVTGAHGVRTAAARPFTVLRHRR